MSENLSQILNNIFEIENISNRKSKQLNELKHNYTNSEFDLKNVLRNQQQLKDKEPQLVCSFSYFLIQIHDFFFLIKLHYLAETEIETKILDEKINYLKEICNDAKKEKEILEDKIVNCFTYAFELNSFNYDSNKLESIKNEKN